MAVFTAAILCCGSASARTVFVNGAVPASGNGASWATAYKYLRDALAATTANDDIWIAKGDYFPDQTVGLDEDLIYADREVSFEVSGQKLYGGFNGTETLLTQRNAALNITILSGAIDPVNPLYSSLNVVVVTANTTLDGLIVEDGLANGYASEPYRPQAVYNQGGACYVSKDRVLTLQNCIFRDNEAILSGAAIMVEDGGTSTVSNVIMNGCIFEDNEVSPVRQRHPRDNAGGAIFGNVTASNSKFIENEVISSSEADGSAKGGAIAGRVIADKCEFIENGVFSDANGTPTASGGAISGDATLVDCNFIENIATAFGTTRDAPNSSGGAIHGKVSGKNCTFIRNESDSDKSYGGAIRGSVNIANFVFEENKGGTGTIDFRIDFNNGREFGGGRGAGGGGAIFTENAESTLVNCVFVKNTSEIRGGAIAADGTIDSTGDAASVITIADSTFVDNGVLAVWDRRVPEPGKVLTPPLFPPVFTTGSAISCMTRVRILNNIFWRTEEVDDDDFSLETMISVTDGGALRNTYESYPSAPDFAKNIIDTLSDPFYTDFDGVADVYVGELASSFIARDPMFVDVADPDGADDIWRTQDDGLRLSTGSSAISTSNTVTIRDRIVPYRNFLFTDKLDIDSDNNVAELVPADIIGFTRVQNTPSISTPVLDLGAYEFGDLSNAQEISIEYPAATVLVDAAGSVDMTALSAIPQTFVIKNLGGSELINLAVSSTGADASSYRVTQPLLKVVPAGGSTTFTVTFAPTALGTKNAVIQISSNDADENPFDINVTGSALLPDIAVDQQGTDLEDNTTVVSYGNVLLSTTSVKSFTIRNNGLGNLGLEGLTLSGPSAANFTLTPPALSFLLPNATTTFDVSFTTNVVGNFNATLVINSTDPDAESLFTIPLTAVGQGIPEILVNQPFPNNAEIVTGSTNGFGTVKTTYTKTFNVTNTGSADITGLTVVITGSKDFKTTAPKLRTLKPGEKTNFKVTFKPSSAGTKTAVLRITSNDSNEGVIDINLTGKGVSASRSKGGSRSAASFAKVDNSSAANSAITVTKAEDGLKYIVLTIEKPADWAVSDQKVEVSSNLVDWFSGQKHTTVLSDTPSVLKVRDNTPYTHDAKRHIRLK